MNRACSILAGVFAWIGGATSVSAAVRMQAFRAATVVCVVAGHAPSALAQVDQQRAQEYFREAEALCERDGGRLWGLSLCAPMVTGDLRTKTFATSQAAPDGARPGAIGLVNAPLEWGGRTWGAYVWDFLVNETPRGRNELLLHELFHAVQPRLGLTLPARTPEHLDAVDGRYWLRLEWRALARALRDSGAQRAAAVGDALAFRYARHALYRDGAEDERVSEITEGLAQYTGTVLAAMSAAAAVASGLQQLDAAETQESFVRTFAYTSGTAYGLLLDASSPGWTRRVRSTDDLATLLMNALGVPSSGSAAAAAARYGGPELLAFEQQRQRERQERIAELRRRFIDGPVLLIRGGGRGSFDSRGAVVIPGGGTVYFGAFRSVGEWGALEAGNGVLVDADGTSRRVARPVRHDDGTVSGDGWTFKPAPGWVVLDGARPGDYEVVRQRP